MSDSDVEIVADPTIITDLDASLRLAEQYNDRIKYPPGIGWIVDDGKRWAENESKVLAFARESARRRTIEVLGTGNKELVNRAMTLESAGHIAGAVKLAESDQRLAVDPAQLDRDPWLLNVENGTIDLRTGELLQHDRKRLITKLAPVHYDPAATHPMLDKFLSNLERAAPGMGAFMSRCAGMSLTGDASAECMFLIQGEGGGSKTTFSDGMGAMLGDYAVKLSFSSFVLSKSGRGPGAASPDLVPLRGSRFAFAAEGDKSARLDAGMVKQLTGNERVTARKLYGEPITFSQTWKLWLVSNFDPQCDSDDTGLWRRIVKVQLPSIPKEHRDDRVKEAMVNDPACRSALLAWAVRGCLAWQAGGGGRKGLCIPGQVENWTDAYRNGQDPIGLWAREAGLSFGGHDTITVAELRQGYESWCNDAGFAPVLGRRFNAWLEGHGARREKRRLGSSTAVVWVGICAKSLDVPDVLTSPVTSPYHAIEKVYCNAGTLRTEPMQEVEV